MSTELAAEQVRLARSEFPGAEHRQISDGSVVVSVPMSLGPGWNMRWVTVHFVLPVAYPSAQPDCFYADVGLRLAGGGMPVNSGLQVLHGEQLVWFSWHVAVWSPTRDNVTTYIRFVESRLRDAR